LVKNKSLKNIQLKFIAKKSIQPASNATGKSPFDVLASDTRFVPNSICAAAAAACPLT
jgi:hypothetical protein